MRAWTTHAVAETPDGTPLSLNQYGDEWIIRARSEDLMSSRMHGSEQEMARLARSDRPDAQVLVGGLGMGFTLRAALENLPPGGWVTVAELVPAVVEWNRGPLGPLAGHPLRDARVKVAIGDVLPLLRANPGFWDVILLDVDNGPDAFTQASNASLYGPEGLKRTRMALRPGGVVAWWSAYDAPEFPKRLQRAGFQAEARQVRAHGGKGARHVIYLGKV
jgi:spermidine synthase